MTFESRKNLNPPPRTLGQKLAFSSKSGPAAPRPPYLRLTVLRVTLLVLVVAILSVLVWWGLVASEPPVAKLGMILGGLAVLALLISFAIRKTPQAQNDRELHFLLAGDRTGFMQALVLDEKTAVFDGSNIYHFGRSNGLDAQPLGAVVDQLRDEGFRIVCFFDANIYYTLRDHGAFDAETRHDLGLLQDIFGLTPNEVYVVPSGKQADRYILSTLKHHPRAFAVTNDQFRDYAKVYGDLMKGDQWRKGIMIKGNQLKLYRHKFRQPIYVDRSG